MRTYIISGIAVVSCSTLAFFAGAYSGLSLGATQPSDCAQAAVDAAPEPEGAAELAEAPAGEPLGEAAAGEPSQHDEDAWPYRAWTDEQETKDDRLYSKVKFLWIRPEARPSDNWLGYLSLGDSVRLKGGSKEAAYAGKSQSVNCHSWYAVEPRGYICIDDDTATFDPDDPVVAMLRKTKANRHSPWPYTYGESTGTPIYETIPPKHVQRRTESALEDHLARVRQARLAKNDEELVAIDPFLAGVDVKFTAREPPTLLPLSALGRTNKHKVVRGSTIGFIDSFDSDGRSWVLSWDRGIIPRDRVKLYDKSSFHGVPVDDKMKLPIAFFRSRQPKMKLTPEGAVVPAEGFWERYTSVMVTEEQIEHGGKRYIVTREGGLLADVDDIAVARRSHYIPEGILAKTSGRRTWIDVSVLGGWLVAYEYDKPVYATMSSAGRGGVPKEGVDPLVTASTPVGKFRITGKFITATMVSNASRDIIHDEVMYTENFMGPYALHGAYWHDEWGKPKSGGCVNLSPIDARRLFAWTDPQLPAGWHSVQLVTGYEGALAEYEAATLVYVHK